MAKEKPPEEGARVAVTLRLPAALHEELKEEAGRLGLDMQGLISVLLWWRLDPHSIVPE